MDTLENNVLNNISSSDSDSNYSGNKVSTNKWANYVKDKELFYVKFIKPVSSLRNQKQIYNTKLTKTNTQYEHKKVISPKSFTNKTASDSKILRNFSEYSHNYHNFFQEYNLNNVLFLIALVISNENSAVESVVYSYPKKNNIILRGKGSYITLQSIVKNDFKAELMSTYLSVGENLFYISYKNLEGLLLIFAIQNNGSVASELHLISQHFLRYLEYLNFAKLIKERKNLSHFGCVCEILNIKLQKILNLNSYFGITSYLKLPKEVEAKIYDALNEMEAMDYRDWNDEPLISQREFFIIGSILYFNSYLISNQLPISHSNHIKQILYFTGILDVIEKSCIQEFVYWSELPLIGGQPRLFLVVCSKCNLTLACLLQSTTTLTKNNPSLFYIEEIQDTLDYLSEKGIQYAAKSTIDTKIFEINKQNKLCGKAEFHKNFTQDLKFSSLITNSNLQSVRINSEISTNKDDEYSEIDSEWDGFPNSYKNTNGNDKSFELISKGINNQDFIFELNSIFRRKGYVTHLVQVNYGSGIIISHVEKFNHKLVEKFQFVCNLIHDILHNFKNEKTLIPNNKTSKCQKHFNGVKEYGVHFTINYNLKDPLKFWVVGRILHIFTGDLYICHQEDIPQNLIEIAFRLVTLIS